MPSLLGLLSAIGACDGDEVEDDPLKNEEVVRCLLVQDQACSEFQAQVVQGFRYTVDFAGARANCSAGWANSGRAGTFAAGSCPTELALGRCRRAPSFLELDYYYEGFGETATEPDPLGRLAQACQVAGGTFELPPF